MMRGYSGWNQTEFQQFQNMMLNVFYPINYGWLYNNLPLTSYANWDLCCIASIMAIGVLCDNSTVFNQGVSFFKTGFGEGAIDKTVYYLHPGYLGQGQEAGRDQGHNTLDVSHLSAIAQMAWNQGVDLYGYGNNRILAMAEYTAKGNLPVPGTGVYYSSGGSYNMPYTIWQYFNWPAQMWTDAFSLQSVGTWRPSWACIYHHYVNVKGK